MDIKKTLKLYNNIESEFFDIDKEKKQAFIKLSFNKPSDIFDINFISKKPVLSDDFMDWIRSCYNLVPRKYKINLDVEFEDMEEYDDETLKDIFVKNIMLEAKSLQEKNKSRNNVGWVLTGMGLVFLLSMIFIEFLWKEESLLRTIFAYVSDILATVTLWEALTLLVVERYENRMEKQDLALRFHSISFTKKQKSE